VHGSRDGLALSSVDGQLQSRTDRAVRESSVVHLQQQAGGEGDTVGGGGVSFEGLEVEIQAGQRGVLEIERQGKYGPTRYGGPGGSAGTRRPPLLRPFGASSELPPGRSHPAPIPAPLPGPRVLHSQSSSRRVLSAHWGRFGFSSTERIRRPSIRPQNPRFLHTSSQETEPPLSLC
jgi:hypothetical protein